MLYYFDIINDLCDLRFSKKRNSFVISSFLDKTRGRTKSWWILEGQQLRSWLIWSAAGFWTSSPGMCELRKVRDPGKPLILLSFASLCVWARDNSNQRNMHVTLWLESCYHWKTIWKRFIILGKVVKSSFLIIQGRWALSNRSLSGKRDGPKSNDLAVRKFVVQPNMESKLYRLCCNHL